MTDDIWRLGDLRPELRAQVGGKALSLGLMMRGGLPVPDGFCIGTAWFSRFLDSESGRKAVGLGADAVARLPLPGGLEGAIREQIARFPGDAVFAVRSSGTLEDLAGASFAGQYETFLRVRAADVPAHVARCFASAFNERVQTYLKSRGGGGNPEMCVVVQRLVAARAAGVAFTVHPQTGNEHRMLVESVAGLGEALVSGQVNPDRFEIARDDGRVVSQALAGGDPTLSPANLAEIAALARRAQALFGAPQDIEFAFDGDTLYLLQSRPITRISFAPDFGEWTTADFREGGVAARVVTPLLWSLYESVMQKTLPGYMEFLGLVPKDLRGKNNTWTGVFFGRPYWNLGHVKRCMARVPGFHERSFDEDMAIEVTYEGDGVVTATTPGRVLAMIPTLFALERGFREQIVRDEQYAAVYREKVAKPFATEQFPVLDDATLFAKYRTLVAEIHDETESNYFMTIYNTSNAKLDFKSSHRKLEQAGVDASYLDLIGGLDFLAPLAPLFEMWKIADSVMKREPAFAKEIVAMSADALATRVREVSEKTTVATLREELLLRVLAYQDRFWYHSRAELDITVPRWCEDLPFVCEMLQSFLRSYDPEKSPEALHKRRVAAFESARDAALAWFAARPWRAMAGRKFRKRLDRMRRFTFWREEMRDYSAQVYGFVRLWTLEVARRLVADGRLETVESVWNLRFQEILALLDGSLSVAEARGLIAKSDEYRASYREFDSPNEIGHRWKVDSRPAAVDRGDGKLFSGVGGSAGVFTGRARVVLRVEDAPALTKGDVLVTRFTDPGWTPLLNQASAVVTEVGGLLSHAAVISREYGIPAVLGVKGVVDRIPDGATVTVDGTRGTVQIVSA